ncbi:MAG: hypothetical protein II442_05910, partial [Oscillospiraceae bacterium]|nr:hypothetical protein [Oscillospiraceae bacterium]
MSETRRRSAPGSSADLKKNFSSLGISTSERPASVRCVVTRAPFVPIGSFATCTTTLCPGFNISLI